MKGTAIIGAISLFLLGDSPADSQDALSETPAEGVRIGPHPHSETVQGVPLDLRVSTFLTPEEEDDHLRLLSRVVVDLSDLQRKIGAIIGTTPLPKDNCDHHGIDNWVARTWGEELSIDGAVATLRLNGQAVQWTCGSIFGEEYKFENLRQSFEARLPLRLGISGQAIAVELGRPDVDLKGGLSEITKEILKLLGVDIQRHVKEAVERAIKPDMLKAPLPAELQRLDPTLTSARFFNNSGALAASLEMTSTLDGDDLLGLFELFNQALQGTP